MTALTKVASPATERSRAIAWFTLALVMVLLLAWLTWDVWDGDGVRDKSERMLVVAGFDGVEHPHLLSVDATVVDEGDLRLTFWMEGEGFEKEGAWKYLEGTFTATFVSDDLSRAPIVCGDDVQVGATTFDALSTQMQSAVTVDLGASTASALAYREQDAGDPQATPTDTTAAAATGDTPPVDEREQPPDPQDFDYATYSVQMGMLSSSYHRWKRWEIEDSDVVWAEQCTVPAEYVWRTSSVSPYEQGSHRALIAPQINFVNPEEGTGTGMDVSLTLRNQAGFDIAWAFPEPTATTQGWNVDVSTHEYSQSLWYTAHPTLVVSERAAAPRRELVLVLYGFLAGALAPVLHAGWSSARRSRDGFRQERAAVLGVES